MATPDSPAQSRRLFASPLARRLAREAGLDLALVPGTGPDARVVGRDVLAAQQAGASRAGETRRGQVLALRGTAAVDRLVALQQELDGAGRPSSIDDLVGRAVELAQLGPAALGSISVVNLGAYGVEEFTAPVEPPHAAALAVGAIVAEPAVVDGQLVAVLRMHVTLSVDARAVDSVVAAQWLRAFLDLLEHPLRIVL